MRHGSRPLWRDPYVPREVDEQYVFDGSRMQAILDVIDTGDPAWPGIAATLQEFTAAGIEINAETARLAVKLGRKRWTDDSRRKPAQESLVTASGSIVYYIRRSALIKIGTTVNPRGRFTDLMPDEILAVEPGGRELETARHGQFSHLQVTGEHFRDTPELRAHIAGIVAMYGLPDGEWPDVASAPRRRWPLVQAASAEMITAIDAETELRINRTTVYQWAHRGRIQPVGEDEHGRQLFNRDHLVWLRDTPRGIRRRSLTA